VGSEEDEDIKERRKQLEAVQEQLRLSVEKDTVEDLQEEEE